jgi:hypothetical protein
MGCFDTSIWQPCFAYRIQNHMFYVELWILYVPEYVHCPSRKDVDCRVCFATWTLRDTDQDTWCLLDFCYSAWTFCCRKLHSAAGAHVHITCRRGWDGLVSAESQQRPLHVTGRCHVLYWTTFCDILYWTAFADMLYWTTFTDILYWTTFADVQYWTTFADILYWIKFADILYWTTFADVLYWTKFADAVSCTLQLHWLEMNRTENWTLN